MATMQELTMYQANTIKDDGLSANHARRDDEVAHDLVRFHERLEG